MVAAYEWKIALRYMLPSRKQVFTSIISCLSLLGIIVGVWALIVVTSVMNGFRAELLERILGVNGHVIMQPIAAEGIADYNKYLAYLKQINKIDYAFPVLENQALIEVTKKLNSGGIVRGIKIEDLTKVKSISSNIKLGKLQDFAGDNIIIGMGMARKYALKVGDYITILSPQGDVTPFGTTPRSKAYKICAIFQIGMYEYDNAIIYMPLDQAQLFFNYDDKVQSIQIFLHNPDDVQEVKKKLQDHFQDHFDIIGWDERNKAFFSALSVERNTMFLILSLIVLVAALNIISSLVMLVKDKTHDIAILRTMGASYFAILRIFLIAGMSIGVLGCAFGMLFGLLTSLNIDKIQHFVSNIFGVDVFNPELYFLTNLPSKLQYSDVAVICTMTMIISFLATLIPALQAARTDPITALRYE